MKNIMNNILEKISGLKKNVQSKEQAKVKSELVKVGLAKKLIFTVTLLLIISLPIMILSTLLQMRTISNEKQEISARDIGHQYSNVFKLQEAEQLAAIEAMSSFVTALQAANGTREQLIEAVEDMMSGSGSMNYVNIMFAPNKFDRQDAEYVNNALYGGYENSGQFGLSIIKSSSTFLHTSVSLLDFYTSTQAINAPHRSDPINLGSDINPLLYTSLNIPIQDGNGEFIGAVGILHPLKDVQILTEQFSTEDSSVAMLTEAGAYVAHADLTRLNTSYDYMDDWANIVSGELTTIERKIDGEIYVVQYISLPFADTEEKWIIEIPTKKAAIEHEFVQARNIAIVLCVIILAVLITVITFALRIWVLKPIETTSKYLSYIAAGDLSKRLSFKSKDEFSEIAHSYNQASESLSAVLMNVTDLSLNVSATSEQMTASAQHTAQASENITLSIEQVSQSADIQFKEITQSNAQIKEMMDGIVRISESVSAASESASNAEQQTVNGERKMQETISQMENVQNSVTKSNEAMKILNEKANEINKIVVMIDELSKQTNLLSLNAAIEASRAGEAGRGFNVVATEIRLLSTQTKQATNQINNLIKEVQSNITTASKAMLIGAQDVLSTVTTVNETGQLFAVIRAEVEHVHTQISEVSAGAEELQASSTDVSNAASQVSVLSQETMSSANEVAAASEEQLATMQEMATSAESLSLMVNELSERMSKFKI